LKKKWLYIPVEIKVRCFDGRLLLACQAADAGFGVVLGSQRRIVEALPFLPPGILLDKDLHIDKEKFFERVGRMGHRIAANDEEGLVYPDAGNWAQLRAPESNLARTAAVFTWGPAQQQILETHYPNHIDHVITTGNPRFDLLRPELRGFFSESVRSIADRHGRYIFMPSNHPLHIHANGPDFLRKQYATLGYTTADERMRFAAKLFEGHLSAMKELAQAFGDMTIIVRPHPGEDHSQWAALVKDYDNVVVEYQGTIEPYLMGAEAIVHNGCTSAIQAVIMDRPVIAYQPFTNEDYDQKFPNSVSLSVSNGEQLIQAVRDAVNGSHHRDSQVDQILRHHISSLDGPFAYVQMVEALSTIDVEPAPFRFQRLKQAVMKAPRRMARNTLAVLSPAAGRLWRYERQKFPGFSMDEVRGIIRRLGDITGAFDRISTTPLVSDLCLIEQQKSTSGTVVGPESRTDRSNKPHGHSPTIKPRRRSHGSAVSR
jgi:surface carbohydrate biosynthesis protein